MKILKLSVVLLTALAMLLTGCTQQVQEPDQDIERTYVCPSGKEVILPPADQLERVVMTSVPLPSIYKLIGGDLDKLVGIHPGSKVDAERSILGKMAPQLLDIESSFMQGFEVNTEELLALKPDVVFFYGAMAQQDQLYDQLGVTSINTKPDVRGDSLEMMLLWVKVLGDVFEIETAIDDIIDYGHQVLDDVKEKTVNLEESEKVKVLTLFRLSEKEIGVSGKGSQGDGWISLTGAKNVAEDLDGTSNVDMEQIYRMNPDVIYIFNNAMPEDLYNNTIKGQDWSKVKAVQDRRVYKIPTGIARWFPPSADAPLMLQWMAQKNYPELFTYDMKVEIKEYYNTYYKYDIADEDIDGILDPVREEVMNRGSGKNY